MFRPVLEQKFKISQKFTVKGSGLLKISFFFKYESLKSAQGALQVKVGDKNQSRIIFNPQKGRYAPELTYQHKVDVQCRKGTILFSILAQALSQGSISIYVSAVKIAFISDQAGPSGDGGYKAGSSLAWNLQGASPHSPKMKNVNFLKNGDFTSPRVPRRQRQLLVTGSQVPSWNISGVGYLKKLPYKKWHWRQAFLLTKSVSLQQTFTLEQKTSGTIRFLCQLDSMPKFFQSFSVYFNGKLIQTFNLKQLQMERMYIFDQQCLCLQGKNTLLFTAKGISNKIGVLILDVSVKSNGKKSSLQAKTQQR